jgi:hypothetical protein
MELVFQGILPATFVFQGGERLILFQIGLFSCVEETHVSLQRQPCVVQALTYRTLFQCENEVVFERNASAP